MSKKDIEDIFDNVLLVDQEHNRVFEGSLEEVFKQSEEEPLVTEVFKYNDGISVTTFADKTVIVGMLLGKGAIDSMVRDPDFCKPDAYTWVMRGHQDEDDTEYKRQIGVEMAFTEPKQIQAIIDFLIEFKEHMAEEQAKVTED